jgi:hypothetical protein
MAIKKKKKKQVPIFWRLRLDGNDVVFHPLIPFPDGAPTISSDRRRRIRRATCLAQAQPHVPAEADPPRASCCREGVGNKQ